MNKKDNELGDMLIMAYELGKKGKWSETDSECVRKLTFINRNIQILIVMLVMLVAVVIASVIYLVALI
jgi:hypothetical protein